MIDSIVRSIQPSHCPVQAPNRQCLSRVFRNALPLPSPGVVLRFLRTPSVRTSGTLPLSQRPRRPMHECVKGSSQPGCKDVLGRQHERHPGGCRFPSPLAEEL